MTKKLVFVRHGQSEWNLANKFTGWVDVNLSDKGVEEAKEAGRKIKEAGIKFDIAYTSILKRAIKTCNFALEYSDQMYVPVVKSWRLNERHYGALRGLNKEFTKRKYGNHQVALWRRSFDTVPPMLDERIEEPKYKKYPSTIIPRAESLKDAYNRILPYWVDEIAPELLHGNNQIVIAHGSTLRAMIKYIENISDEGIDGVEVANAEPIIYELDNKLRVISKKILK